MVFEAEATMDTTRGCALRCGFVLFIVYCCFSQPINTFLLWVLRGFTHWETGAIAGGAIALPLIFGLLGKAVEKVRTSWGSRSAPGYEWQHSDGTRVSGATAGHAYNYHHGHGAYAKLSRGIRYAIGGLGLLAAMAVTPVLWWVGLLDGFGVGERVALAVAGGFIGLVTWWFGVAADMEFR